MTEKRYRRLTTSGQISSTPTLVFGVFVQSPANGVGVTLYDDIAANDEHKIHEVAGLANDFIAAPYRPFLPTERALYIEFGSNVTECLVIFEPLGT